MNLKKNQNVFKSSFVSFILLVKLKSNRDQIHGLNWVLANKVNLLIIHYTVICFFCKTHSYRKRETSQSGIQFYVVHNLPTKLPQKSWMKIRFFLASRRLQSHPNATNWRWWRFWVKHFPRLSGPERQWLWHLSYP
jgi:hypothetical protein